MSNKNSFNGGRDEEDVERLLEKLDVKDKVLLARLSREDLLEAARLGLGRVSSFRLDQLIDHFFDSQHLRDLGGPEVSLYFRLHICKQISRIINENHMSTPPTHQGSFHTESVLLDLNLDAKIEKLNNPESAERSTKVEKLQKDIMDLGVLILETMTLSRVTDTSFPSVLTCVEIGFSHLEEFNEPNSSDKLSQRVLKEVHNAITTSANNLTFDKDQIDEFTDTLIKTLTLCLDLNPGNRPMAIELERMFATFQESLFPDVVHEDELSKMVKLIIKHKILLLS